jgi:hypothetical protein
MSTFLFLVCLTAAHALLIAFAADVYRHKKRAEARTA